MEQIEKRSRVRLTELSHGAGCGCKISPGILEKLIQGNKMSGDPCLLVGNHTNDDAAVYDIGNGRAIISTTDFFMPIVDDPYDFGVIASVNALSDIYAMSGRPLMALAILGWPIDKVDHSIAGKVLEGARDTCKEAGIEVAGGHSIDNPEPIFGLAVTGTTEISKLKKNSTAKPGSLLYLTKPLGVGLVTTAQKSGLAKSGDLLLVTELMKESNKIGMELGELEYINAMTDVTGFGLLGHLKEMCESSQVSAEISYKEIPRIKNIEYYIRNNTVPGGTLRNWESYGSLVNPISQDWINLLADPQTSGGLLISVEAEKESVFTEFMKKRGFDLNPIGSITEQKEILINID